MSKYGQYVHILLDNSTYIAVKAKGGNISDTGRKLFKAWVEAEDVESPEEAVILAEMEEIKARKLEDDRRLSIIAVQLARIREDKEAETKAREQEVISKLDAMRKNNPLRSIIRGGVQ